jgi:Na+/H+ antiporter NhaD/arsenite permease-like protein
MSPASPSLVELAASALFALAVLHTFSTKLIARLGHLQPRHAGLWHLLAEVEVVFGVWALALVACLFALQGEAATIAYVDSRNYGEPMFVFVVMVVAASRPVLSTVMAAMQWLAIAVPVDRRLTLYFLCLTVVPLFGSFITEPAAMTLAALALRDGFFRYRLGAPLKYATLGTLFVNVSIGGTLTSFAAPPVLMVASKWGWDSSFMLLTFGWKAALAVLVNGFVLSALFRREIIAKGHCDDAGARLRVPSFVAAVHFAFLVAVVGFAHHPTLFLGLFLLFLGYCEAYSEYQDRLILREGLLVAFFLGGLVVLGGLQRWWLEDALTAVSPTALFYLSTALTAITDNAALTYLASLVEGVSPDFQYAVVAGAVSGGGLTVIANAPNPAGIAILKGSFAEEAVSPAGLFAAALPPTIVAALAFVLL